MSYIKYNVRLTKGQKEKLLTSYRKRAPITLRLKHNQLSGRDEMFLTRRQIAKVNKSKRDGTGTDVKISGTQIRKQSSGSLFSTLLKFGTKAIPYAGKAVGSLASGALSGLGGLAVDKLFGSGLFSVPQDKVDKLIRYKSYLTEAQKKQILAALQTGGGIPRFKLTKKQSGGFLGSLLASIGIPLIVNALTGSGLQVGPGPIKSSRSVYVPRPKGGLVDPTLVTPPFYGDFGDCCKRGSGLKKKSYSKKGKSKGKGLATRTPQSIQEHPSHRSHTMRFMDRPLSSDDILRWVKYLGIKHFRGVFSRDDLPTKIRSKECGIINLDTKIGPRTHWVTYRNIDDDYCEYFDSFGLDMPAAVRKYFRTSGKPLEHSGDEIQSRYSVLCGYWCLYYLRERQIGRTMLHVIHNQSFDMTNASVNHAFITDYFKILP